MRRDISTQKLKNGLIVCSAHQPHLHTMAAAMYVRAGSGYETPDTNGISHMTEHMIFRGTPNFETAKEHSRAIERVGGAVNAWTSRDMVSYHVTAPTASGQEVVQLLLEMFAGPRFQGFEKERQTILEEVRADFGAAGQDLDSDDVVRSMAFGNHPLGMKIAGTVDSVSRLNERHLKNHFSEYYTGTNMSLVLTGNLKKVKIPTTSSIPKGSCARDRKMPLPKVQPSGVRFVRNQDSAQIDIQVALRAPGRKDKDYLPTQVLAHILNGGVSARVEQMIREPGLAYEAYAEYDAVDDVGLFSIGASTSGDKIRDLVDGIFLMLSGTRIITDDDLHLAKKQLEWNLDETQDSPLYLADTLGLSTNRGKNPDLEAYRSNIRKVTKEDVIRSASRMISERNLYVACIGSLKPADKRAIEKQLKMFSGDRYKEGK